MSKIKLLTIASICLLILNLTLIWIGFSHKPMHPREVEPKQLIIDKLGFDAQQIIEYEKLIDLHGEKIKNSRQNLFVLKMDLFNTLKNSKPTNNDSLLTEIAKEEKNIEQNNYNHFEDIKKICKPNQLSAYNQFVSELADIFTPKPMRQHEEHH